jgi:ribosomal peptide maturation radical SAM protein 1
VPAKPSIVLVCLPWAASTRPSLGLGLLVAHARQRGFPCRAEYLNLDFAAAFGPEAYELMASHDELFALGEHVFAVDLFGRKALRAEAFLDRFFADGPGDGRAAALLDPEAIVAARDVLVPDALERYTERILATDPDVVGMTCVFNQVLPSLALARRLKLAKPGLRVLLGGSCVHGRMGETYASSFPDLVDHVFTGEADQAFPALLEALSRGKDPSGIPGVTTGGSLKAPAELFRGLDDLPVPHYDDFFAARRELGRRLPERFDLVFESSRGCWWGQKSHCTFCGLNNEGMAYRMKSADRIIAELIALSGRHRCLDFEAADNILPQEAYRTLLPRLAESGADFRFLYEIKANITRDDAGILARAGVRWVQPGVESFSDHVLQLMRKGSTGAQNIQLLKWLQEAGVTPYYNILVGFPGETAADFEEMLELLPALFHLTPPVRNRSALVSVHRFAPFFNQPERWGIEAVRPAWYYRYLIPPGRAPAGDFAFFFDRKVPRNAPVHRYRERLDVLLGKWVASRIQLRASLGPGFISILKTRAGRSREIANLSGLDAAVFLLCDRQTGPASIARELAATHPELTEPAIAGSLASLVRQRLLVQCGDRWVGVVPFDRFHGSAELDAWRRKWIHSGKGQIRVGAGATTGVDGRLNCS